MLDLLEKILPIGPDKWNEVVELHSEKFPRRNFESLQRKYNTLHQKSIPIGDPHCPPEVKQAKQIKHLIGSSHSQDWGCWREV